MQIFVINLEKDHARRESMQKQLDDLQLAFEFFPGVLGSALSAKELAECYDDKKAKSHQCMTLVPAHIGCSLSHVNVYREIISRNLPCALILEDDVVLPKTTPDLIPKVFNAMNVSNPEVILLSPAECNIKSKLKRNIGHDIFLAPFKSGYFTSSYIITNTGARALLKELFPIANHADCWNRMKLYKVVDIFVLSPALINQDQSTFGSSTTEEILIAIKALNKWWGWKWMFKARRAWAKLRDFFYGFYRRKFVPYSGIFKDGSE
jgi:glycosyl transferase family 25